MNETIDTRISDAIDRLNHIESIVNETAEEAAQSSESLRKDVYLLMMEGSTPTDIFYENMDSRELISIATVGETHVLYQEAAELCDGMDDVFGGGSSDLTPEQRSKGGLILLHLQNIRNAARLAEESLYDIQVLRKIVEFAAKEG